MASSSYKTFLMHAKTGTAYEKLVDIKDYPDLGGEPEMLQTTTLSDKMHTYTPGIQSLEGMSFTANYDKEAYTKLEALKDKDESYSVWFGGTESGEEVTPTGEDGKFDFKGKLSVFVSGGGVNEVRNMTITIAPSTPITMATA
jgi:hypothetical protein